MEVLHISPNCFRDNFSNVRVILARFQISISQILVIDLEALWIFSRLIGQRLLDYQPFPAQITQCSPSSQNCLFHAKRNTSIQDLNLWRTGCWWLKNFSELLNSWTLFSSLLVRFSCEYTLAKETHFTDIWVFFRWQARYQTNIRTWGRDLKVITLISTWITKLQFIWIEIYDFKSCCI